MELIKVIKAIGSFVLALFIVAMPYALIIAQINALNTYKKLIHGLPDGYPVPIRK